MKRIQGRIVEVGRLVRAGDLGGITRRLVRRAYLRSGAATLDFGLRPGDVADSTTVSWATATATERPSRGAPLHIGWVTTPPRAGSGGHTTMFRMVQALVDAGHSCTLYLYDRFGGETSRHAAVIRESWPWLDVEIADATSGIGPADAFVATSWESAHVMAKASSTAGERLYFIQDYEPYFYARGSEYALSEDTYRFGYRSITVGRMIAEILRADFGVECAVAEFGCDTKVYKMANNGPRNGVVFYAKPNVPRRGYLLGVLALAEFHRRHPDQKIHIFGDPVSELPFPATLHGTVTPAQLSEIYNTCAAGLAISFTNVSLVPVEMMACGAIPVMNDSEHARPGFDNEHGVWAQPTPDRMADALSRAVTSVTPAERTAAAASVLAADWEAAKRTLVDTVEDAVYRR